MKGIILAGGSGTRMWPMTQVVSKQLLPIYDKPMIYYPLSTLMRAGIREILIISTPTDLPKYRTLFGDGRQYGLELSYIEQPNPDGLAQAFILGREFIGDDQVCLILGDNVFIGSELDIKMYNSIETVTEKNSAVIFGYQVKDPERYGVLEFDNTITLGAKRVCGLEEKPSEPKSNYAIPGLYFYPNSVVEYVKYLRPSTRNELEITDLNRIYLEKNELYVELLSRGTAWLDTGTPESMQQASDYIAAIQQRSGLIIACLEEIAYLNHWITPDEFYRSAKKLNKSQYGQYLCQLLKEYGISTEPPLAE